MLFFLNGSLTLLPYEGKETITITISYKTTDYKICTTITTRKLAYLKTVYIWAT